MKEINAITLGGFCTHIEERLIEEFKSKPQYIRRTVEGLSTSIGLDKELIEFILKESFYFEICEGCKGEMWRLIG